MTGWFFYAWPPRVSTFEKDVGITKLKILNVGAWHASVFTFEHDLVHFIFIIMIIEWSLGTLAFVLYYVINGHFYLVSIEKCNQFL